MRPPIASAIAGKRARARQYAVELPSAVVGHDDPVGASLAAASRASSGSRMPLMISGPSHCERTHSTSFQLTLASKLRADPAHQVGKRAR